MGSFLCVGFFRLFFVLILRSFLLCFIIIIIGVLGLDFMFFFGCVCVCVCVCMFVCLFVVVFHIPKGFLSK